ncbi:hypothetical protein MNBD_GAMMA06-776 [hydrothermal vent metagenome]|uniref:DUF4129 domain-containing protein n=1 Tax=hydrothermal vent metagenome TaxID=652676 RepID=A0A3B0X6M6_9ZZZZ
MALVCPDIVVDPEYVEQSQSFNDSLIATDSDFTSHEDCDMFASYFYDTTDLKTNLSDSPLVLSNLDVIVDEIWKPEEEQGLNLLFDAMIDWFKSFGINVDVSALQQYLPSIDSVRLFTELSVSLLLLLAVVFFVRGLSGSRGYTFPRLFRFKSANLKVESNSVLSFEPIEQLSFREQLGILLQRSVMVLQKSKAIPVSVCYTNHELIDCMDMNKNPAAKLLYRQVKLAEPAIYGARPVTQEVLAESQKIYYDISRISC